MKHCKNHYTNRANWLRAAVLGANDGILSTTSLAMVVTALAGYIFGVHTS